MRSYALLLGALAAAFAARVGGQLVVALSAVDFLPPMHAWYSGLLPYAVLLPVQVVILIAQFQISRELWLGRGWLTLNRPKLGRILAWFSLIYFFVMLARLVVTRVVLPDPGQLGGTIPILFHWVLAAYAWVFSRYLRGMPFFGRPREGSCPA